MGDPIVVISIKIYIWKIRVTINVKVEQWRSKIIRDFKCRRQLN